MNPVYDLFVIGVVILIVGMNLYHSREHRKQSPSIFSVLRERLTTVNVFNVYR